MRMKKIQEGLGELADAAERDHEVQMARSDLYKLAKYAIKLHDMLKGVSEAEGIEGWQQAKITKAADYISSVYHALDYDMKFANGGQMAAEMPTESKDYLQTLQSKLSEKTSTVCSECGNPSWRTLDEEKQKGVDGKVCWKGYRRQGTKMKGGRRVDNCVKVGS